MLQVLDLLTGLFEHEIEEKIATWFFENEGMVTGPLGLSRKFICFGSGSGNSSMYKIVCFMKKKNMMWGKNSAIGGRDKLQLWGSCTFISWISIQFHINITTDISTTFKNLHQYLGQPQRNGSCLKEFLCLELTLQKKLFSDSTLKHCHKFI